LILKEKITNDNAKDKALKSAIKITTINGTANAVLIKHPKLGLIAANNKHVVETSNNSCYDRIIDLRLLDSNIALKSKKIYISKIEDLAIIELEFDKIQKKILNKLASVLSTKQLSIGTDIFGYCYFRDRIVYNHGKIMEHYQKDNNTIYESDIGGSHGFSGCGYFNNNGELNFIHRSAGNYHSKKNEANNTNKDFLNKNELFRSSDEIIGILCENMIKVVGSSNNTSFDYDTFVEGINEISSLIHTISRNPRTQIIAVNEKTFDDFSPIKICQNYSSRE